MKKPFTLKVQETTEKIIKIINESEMPAYVLKNILTGIFNELTNLEQEEIRKYNEENTQNKQKKE